MSLPIPNGKKKKQKQQLDPEVLQQQQIWDQIQTERRIKAQQDALKKQQQMANITKGAPLHQISDEDLENEDDLLMEGSGDQPQGKQQPKRQVPPPPPKQQKQQAPPPPPPKQQVQPKQQAMNNNNNDIDDDDDIDKAIIASQEQAWKQAQAANKKQGPKDKGNIGFG